MLAVRNVSWRCNSCPRRPRPPTRRDWSTSSARRGTPTGKQPPRPSSNWAARRSLPSSSAASRGTSRSGAGPSRSSGGSRARCSPSRHGPARLQRTPRCPKWCPRSRTRTGMKISLFPENLPRWKTERVNLREPEAMPFWKAIDRLCQATSLHGDLELHGLSARNEPTLALGDRSIRPAPADLGPRPIPRQPGGPGLSAARGLRGRGVPAAAEPGGPAGRRRGGLRSPAAPPGDERAVHPPVAGHRRAPTGAEPERARADQGGGRRPRELAGRGRSGRCAGGARGVGLYGGHLHPRPPSPRATPSARKRRRRRSGPSTARSPSRSRHRRADPLVVPLAGAPGKTFGDGDVRVTVHEVRTDPNNRQRQIDLSVQLGRPGGAARRPTYPPPWSPIRGSGRSSRTSRSSTQGAASCPGLQTGVNVEASTNHAHARRRTAGATSPRSCATTGSRETMVDVPFAFTDVPMP